MAIHSIIFAWRFPWTKEPGGLQSMGPQKVRHDSATVYRTTKSQTRLSSHTHTHTHPHIRYWESLTVHQHFNLTLMCTYFVYSTQYLLQRNSRERAKDILRCFVLTRDSTDVRRKVCMEEHMCNRACEEKGLLMCPLQCYATAAQGLCLLHCQCLRKLKGVGWICYMKITKER